MKLPKTKILSLRELEVLRLILADMSNKQVADYLHLSIKTVEKHRVFIYRKLDVHSTVGLYYTSLQKGLIQPPPLSAPPINGDAKTDEVTASPHGSNMRRLPDTKPPEVTTEKE